jgi:hypothetical protein
MNESQRAVGGFFPVMDLRQNRLPLRWNQRPGSSRARNPQAMIVKEIYWCQLILGHCTWKNHTTPSPHCIQRCSPGRKSFFQFIALLSPACVYFDHSRCHNPLHCHFCNGQVRVNMLLSPFDRGLHLLLPFNALWWDFWGFVGCPVGFHFCGVVHFVLSFCWFRYASRGVACRSIVCCLYFQFWFVSLVVLLVVGVLRDFIVLV